MGVSGSGKSTIGKRVATQLRLPFLEGDDFHTRANIDKMSAGIALTDTDRIPWIDALARAINESGCADVIVACSALSRSVRERLRNEVKHRLRFIYLRANRETIAERMRQRQHFMKVDLLPSQFAALEVPQDAIEIDCGRSVEEVVLEVVTAIGR
jgi:gluconokinase